MGLIIRVGQFLIIGLLIYLAWRAFRSRRGGGAFTPGAPPEIGYLPDDDAVVRTLATWHQAQWGKLTGRSVPERILEFADQRASRDVPLTRIAMVDGELAGNASLLEDDMDTHADLGPWLASVYVHPRFRRRGVATALCGAIMDDARRLGFRHMYLYTPDQEGLYARLGWEVVSHEEYHGEMVTLMEYGFDREN